MTEKKIAEQVAERLEQTSPEGRQPMPRARRRSTVALGVALLITAVLLLVAGIQLGVLWTLVGGLAVAAAIFLVVGFPVLVPAAMRSREEIAARREVADDAPRPHVIRDPQPSTSPS